MLLIVNRKKIVVNPNDVKSLTRAKINGVTKKVFSSHLETIGKCDIVHK